MKKKLYDITPIPMLHQIIWWVVRGLLLIFAIHGLFTNSVTEFLMGMFSIAFSHLWDMFQLFGGRSFISRVSYSSQTLLNIFIFFGCVVGPYLNIKTQFQYSDIILHFTSGIVATWFGYDFAETIQGKHKPISPALAALFCLGFSISIAVGWEFYEFTMDRLYGYTLQTSDILSERGLVDTMVDFIMSAAGSVVGMFIVSFTKNGIIGPNRKEIRARVKEEYKKHKELELKFLEEQKKAKKQSK